jgi:hypothetical protein
MNSKIILYLIGVFIVAFPLQVFGDGACCNPTNGNCSINFNQGDCFEGDGIWQGDDTDCDPNPCPQPQPTDIPTLSEWGMVIFMVVAGLGSVYYLRRQRKAES